MRRVVVLPAPLGPRTPVIVPDSIVKLTSSTARTFLPNRLVKCSAWMTAGMLPPGRAVVGRVRARPSLHEEWSGPSPGVPVRGRQWPSEWEKSSQRPLRSSAQYTLPATMTGLT